MTKEEIRGWLYSVEKDRHWLAEQIGCTYGTLSQWFSKGFPEWAVKSISRLAVSMRDSEEGFEVTFTHSEWQVIECAMRLDGYNLHRDFYQDAVLKVAREIIEREERNPANKRMANVA